MFVGSVCVSCVSEGSATSWPSPLLGDVGLFDDGDVACSIGLVVSAGEPTAIPITWLHSLTTSVHGTIILLCCRMGLLVIQTIECFMYGFTFQFSPTHSYHRSECIAVSRFHSLQPNPDVFSTFGVQPRAN